LTLQPPGLGIVSRKVQSGVIPHQHVEASCHGSGCCNLLRAWTSLIKRPLHTVLSLASCVNNSFSHQKDQAGPEFCGCAPHAQACGA
jgi:hypothetical protein